MRTIMRMMVVLGLTAFTAAASGEAPIALRPGVVLFIDDHFIAQSEGLTRTAHRPERQGAPVVGLGLRPWQPWLTVLRDPATGTFRMWYDTHDAGEGSEGTDGDAKWAESEFSDPQNYLGTVESTDGIHWVNRRKLFQFNGFCASVLDEGADFQPAAERYKLAYFSLDRAEKEFIPKYNEVRSGMWVATSADGLAWRNHETNPVLPFYWHVYSDATYEKELTPTEANLFELLHGICANDILNVYRDPFRGGYALTCKMMSFSSAEFGTTSRTARAGIRTVGLSRSADFQRWFWPRRLFAPDEKDEGVFEFYGMSVHPRGNQLIGMVKILRDDLSPDPGGEPTGVGYTTLGLSHDGENWTRFREPFFDRNSEAGSWDHAHAWIDDIVDLENETWFYYGGYKGGHKEDRYRTRLIGLARLRRDGYVSRDAGEKEGRLVTHPLVFEANGMKVNANVRGSLRVRLLDEGGKAIDGYESEPIRGDSVGHEVRFAKSLGELNGRAVRIEFSMSGARLFGFELR